MKSKKVIFEIIETFALSAAVYLIISIIIGSIEVVWGSSMEPNFHTNERILVDRISKKIRKYNRGEVVVFFPPNDESKHYIKRVIGIPGDIIKILDCKVLISRDGEKYVLDEYYLSEEECTTGGNKISEGRSLRLAEDEYLLLGDNRDSSIDSRFLGLIKEDKIIGRVIFRFWPIDKAGFIN